MSGKPSTEGVAKFREMLAACSQAYKNIERLDTEIADCQRELETWKESGSRAFTALFEMMDKMDVASNGNCGYEGRMSWFLIELHRQYSESAPVEEPRA